MILVTGATGTVGRPLVHMLVGAGAKVRAVTRHRTIARQFSRVDVVEADPSRPETLAPVLDGVTALFVNPRAVGASVTELLTLAKSRGVRRVVTLSALNVDDELEHQPSRFRGDRNKEVESAVVASGLTWVSLRASAFAFGSLLAWGSQIRAGDVVRGAYPRFAEAPIDERDLAEVGARALLTDELANRKLELTGPRSLTHEEMVTIIGEMINRPLRYQEIPQRAVAEGMAGHGLPEPFVAALMARYARGDGQSALVTNEVETILGRPARDYSAWVGDHAAAFQNGTSDRSAG